MVQAPQTPTRRFLTMFLAVAFLFGASVAQTLPTPPVSECATSCGFSLCDPAPLSLMTVSDVPLTSMVCMNDVPIGTFNTGEAQLQVNMTSFIPLSNFTTPDLAQQFSASFIKSYSNSTGSGIGHEVPQQNQAEFLGGACLAVPIVQFELLDESGAVMDSVNVEEGSPLVDCVPITIANVTLPTISPTIGPTPSESPMVSPDVSIDVSMEPFVTDDVTAEPAPESPDVSMSPSSLPEFSADPSPVFLEATETPVVSFEVQ